MKTALSAYMKNFSSKFISIIFLFLPHLNYAADDSFKLSYDLEIVDEILNESTILEKPSKLLIYSILSEGQIGNISNLEIIDDKRFKVDIVALNRLMRIPVTISFEKSEGNKFFYIIDTNLSVLGVSGNYQVSSVFTLHYNKKSILDVYLPNELVSLLPDDTLEKIERKINYILSVNNQKKLSAYMLNQNSDQVLFDLINYKNKQNNEANVEHNLLTKFFHLIFFIFILYLPILFFIFRKKIPWQLKK